MRRVFAVLAVAAMLASGLFVFASEPAAALSKTWASDTDFSGGAFISTQVVGTGTAASIQLQLNPMYNWIKMDPATPPTPRRGTSMTYDEQNGVLLAFGGVRSGLRFTSDLWAYSVPLATWTNITPASSPPARWKAGLSYDPVQRTVILYGGEDASGWRRDLWRYYVTNNTWLDVTPSFPAPRNMQSTPLVYDIAAGRHVMAGTNSVTSAFETWAYDAAANQWTNRNPAGSVPPSTSGHTLTYDRVTNKVVLFGGANGLTLYGDVWEYDYTSNTWVLARAWEMNKTPNPRTDHAMVFGPNGAASILFGGIGDGSAYQPETWYYLSAQRTWMLPDVTITPLARKDHALAWDSTRDRTIMFGGQLSDGSLTNETWMWGPGYFSSGTYESPMFDAGCDSPLWRTLWWNATRPATTTARFKLATSNSPTGPFDFVGWDGLPGTFYNGTPGQTIWSGHNQPPNQRYFRWMTRLTTGTGGATPAVDDLAVEFVCFEQLPYIVSTNPANLASGVRLTADIVATFNIPMNPTSASWTFSDPAVSFTPSWNAGHTVLTLSHVTAFKKCTFQTIQIFGRDEAHNLSLAVGPVPNPWRFSTDCSAPKILQTTPADGDFSVALTADLLVQFSEPMNTSTVTWTISGGIALSGSWNPAETDLTLTHATPFALCTEYTARIVTARDKVGVGIVPGPVPNPWSFSTVCPNPYIARTDPADGALQVPVGTPIVVTFSKPMDTASVAWTISPFLALTESWSGGDTVLTLNHTATFAEITRYFVNITGGREKGGLPLIAGPVPNPWSFWTGAVRPQVLRTDPADGATGVALDATIVVTFSEAMDTASVAATILPAIGLTRSWNSPTNTVLTLSHTTPFAECNVYTVNVTGMDLQGFRLVPGPVPDPWSFAPSCPLRGPGHLRVTMAGADVRLSWDPVSGATQYRVYGAQNRFAAWAAWSLLGTTTAPPFLATGHGADGLTHYYIVRAWDGTKEGPNSTMGVKTQLAFGYSPSNTNIAWFSLPFSSTYLRASDIANALGSANVDLVGKWDPSKQSSIVYYYARGRWRGTDFAIAAGDGLYLGVRRAFGWNVTGTDLNVSLSFTLNPVSKGNVNWISLPYTGVYGRASDITSALGSTRITEVGLWNPATQSSVRWYWSGTAWTGTDFAIAPGAGVYLIIASSFTWTPTLITPAVP